MKIHANKLNDPLEFEAPFDQAIEKEKKTSFLARVYLMGLGLGLALPGAYFLIKPLKLFELLDDPTIELFHLKIISLSFAYIGARFFLFGWDAT